MAWINAANPAGARGPMVYGDVGRACGKAWFMSGWYHSGGMVSCMWMTNNPDHPDNWIRGMSYDGAYFNMEHEHDGQDIKDDICQVQNVNFDRENIYPLGDAFYDRRRSERDSDYISSLCESLVISDDGDNQAMCNSEASYGKSFYSHETVCYVI